MSRVIQDIKKENRKEITLEKFTVKEFIECAQKLQEFGNAITIVAPQTSSRLDFWEFMRMFKRGNVQINIDITSDEIEHCIHVVESAIMMYNRVYRMLQRVPRLRMVTDTMDLLGQLIQGVQQTIPVKQTTSEVEVEELGEEELKKFLEKNKSFKLNYFFIQLLWLCCSFCLWCSRSYSLICYNLLYSIKYFWISSEYWSPLFLPIIYTHFTIVYLVYILV